ncbi:MAG: hypothetical protein AAF485_03230 [Chloroflexota bacterium]
MEQQKVLQDWIITTQETIYLLHQWQNLLEEWQIRGEIGLDDFQVACQELREAGLWPWASDAGGHGIAALAGLMTEATIS